jgi:hypothetical protein
MRINCTVPVPGVAQTIVVCRLRTVLELGKPRKTMACPTDDPFPTRWPISDSQS